MTTKATTASEPAWSWIIAGGLAVILAGGAMLQMQFGGVRPSQGFATLSGYETVATPTHAVNSSEPAAVVPPPVAGSAAAVPLQLNPFSPPTSQPDWLIAPCSAARAAHVQQLWADYLGVPSEVSNRLGQTFRLVPPGIYDRGAQLEAMQGLLGVTPEGDTHWRDCLLSSVPAHRVVISQAFYLAVHETTQAEYSAIMGRNPAWYSSSGREPYYVDLVKGEETGRHPVEGVTWNDAREFARKLAASEFGEIAALNGADPGEIDCGLAGEACGTRGSPLRYRLPTDAEWEHACRGGSASPFFFGEAESVARGWFGEPNSGRTWPVGNSEANPLGLYGVHSGVWEWVADQWAVVEYASYRDWPVMNPLNAAGTPLPRVVRGGMWPDRRSRAFDRYAYDEDFQTFFVGFRLALEVPSGRGRHAAEEQAGAKPD